MPNAALRFRPAEVANAMVGGPPMGGSPAADRREWATRAMARQSGGGASEALVEIADRLQLMPRSGLSFEQSLQAMRERMQQMRAARGAGAGRGPHRPAMPPSGATAGGGDRSKRIAQSA